MRRLLVAQAVTLPTELLTETDPLAVLRSTTTVDRPAVVHLVDQALRREEITAARTAQPTPYGRDVIVSAHQTSRKVAVVSNNSAESVRVYLEIHQLTSYVHPVIGRSEATPERMKPDPVLAALHELGAKPAECVLVGDSVSDVEAATPPESPPSDTRPSPASANDSLPPTPSSTAWPNS